MCRRKVIQMLSIRAMPPRQQDKLQRALGVTIRHRRETLGLSQEALAELVGIHRTYVGSVERGERNVSLQNLALFAGALRWRLSELIVRMEKEMDAL